MITSLKPYPAYKDSGVPWLGQVPEHWDVRRIKRIAWLNPSKSEVPLALRDGRAVFLPMERVGSDGRFDASEVRPISDLWNGYTYFRRGDVIVAKITPCFENGKGACLENLPTALGFGSTEFHVIRPCNAIVSAYLYRATTLSEFRQLGADEMTGAAGQQRVPVEFIGNFSIPIPPLPQQTAIVRFLDYMDRRMRRYIRARQKLIKLLEEYRQALIHRAVTGQIDVRTGQPYPAYKDSGIEWLGKVPEHWEVRRVKTICRMKAGENITNRQIEPSGDFPVYGGNGIRGYTSCFSHEGEFILIGRQGALCGNIHLVQGRFWASEHAIVVSPYGGHYLQWFAALLEAMKLNQYSMAAAQPGLSVERVMNLWAPVPHGEEQRRIAEYAMFVTLRIRNAISASRREIDLVREYRERLIADVFTGKVDVREVAARLPEGPPEEEAGLEEIDETVGDDASGEESDAETVEEEEES
ncbi:MAG: restriction endonuclease subunit S [Chloroflexota bacterium]